MQQNSQNLTGPAVRRLRKQLGLKQDELAARLCRKGWDCSENTVSKIEAGFRRVNDFEAHMLAQVLGVEIQDIFPTKTAKPGRV